MVIICINFVDLVSPLIHAMFQDHGSTASDEEIFLIINFDHGGHLGHVN